MFEKRFLNYEIDNIQEYYKMLCSISYKNHPIYEETLEMKKLFLEYLIYNSHCTNYEIYRSAMKSVYENIFLGENVFLESINITKSQMLMKQLKKLRIKIFKFGIHFYNYKYLYLAHYLINRYGEVKENDSYVQMISNKENLKINDEYLTNIIHYTNALKAGDFKKASELLSTKPCNKLVFIFEAFKEYFENLKKEEKSFLVIGTMSSGKSTFLNCLVGKELFPSQNEACTAKIFTYTSNQNIDRYFISTNYEWNFTCEFSLDSSVLSEKNKNLDIKRVDIEGALSPLYNTKRKIRLIDTPGTNNSMDFSHQEVTYEALLKEEFDIVIYILNATQLGTDDDEVLLKYVKESVEKRQKEIVFVVNKVDEIDEGNNESIQSLAERTKMYLEQNGFINAKVIFVSAYAARLGQAVLSNSILTRREKKQFDFYYDYFIDDEVNLNQYSTLHNSQVDIFKQTNLYDSEVEKYEIDKVYKVLKNSGIYQISSLF